ncbi:unnamed protein product [Schistosoma rodhaini]|uniref:TROVE domain-containing protein n=1 Tax=Schistosoma rodhaini TaxID=6188 RepID=A0AA85FZT5_9TREM|nr:unnamed protein product [Schistosoma rodhaini]
MRMDHESGYLQGPSSLLSPVYLEGKNLVKNKLLDEPFAKTSSASSTLSSLSLNNESLKSSISLSYTGSVLHCDHKETIRPNGKHHEAKQTSDASPLKSTPIDWLKDAIIKISDTSFQDILECTVGDSIKSNPIHNTFGDLLTYERGDTYKQLKLGLISCISSSIVDGSPSKEKKIILGQSIHACIDKDPEFILKAALYCRRELNIRTTTNMLIAIASCNERSRSFIKKYFSSCIRTPSDWIEVAEYYATISGNFSLKGIPKVLRSSMTSKFLEFDQYQLAKHSKHRARANRSTKSKALKKSRNSAVVSTDIDVIIYRLAHSPRIYFTIKELIRRLHISKPKFNVMCVLGKPYPSDSTDFIRMGLEGDWDSSKAGTRMKFPVPVTWETELSVNGNNSDSWSKLITLNKVPHMALLRNLRNIFLSNVQDSIHEIVLKRLTDPRIIMEGKQFPFRYFAAFDTIDKLKRDLYYHRFVMRTTVTEIMKRKKTTPRQLKKSEWLEKSMKKGIGKFLLCDFKMLDRYKNALSTALELSMKHNLPPICGSTLIICSTSKYVNSSKHKSSKSYIKILGFLLGAMCTSICETPTTYVTVDDQYNLTPIEVVLRGKQTLNNYDKDSDVCGWKQNEYRSKRKSMGILERTKQMYKRRKSLRSTSITTVFEKLYAYRKQFDKIVVFGDCHKEIVDYVINYRTYIGPLKAIWGNLSGEDVWPNSCSKDGWIEFKGCTDQILRYIAEPNEDKLLERIEEIDEIYGLNKNISYHFNLKTKTQENLDNSILSKHDYFRSGWKCCQLFISSTFRDMHAERDLLCGILVPALRRNVALGLRVHLNEIDLRWGVPEPVTYNSQALQICLEQAAASDIFVLLLGDRYGCIPDETEVMALPESLLSEVCKFYKPGMSMTEMEYHMARQAAISKVPIHERRQQNTISFHEAIRLRICVFIRDSASIENVPDELKHYFEEYDIEKRNRLNAFKELIRNDGVIISYNYSAQFNGLINDYPVMGNLDEFGSQFLATVKSLLLRLFHNDNDNTPIYNNDHNLPITANKSLNTIEFLREYVYSAACAIGPRHLLEVEQAFNSLTERGRRAHLTRAIQSTENKLSVQNNSNYPTNLQGCDGSILLIVGSNGSGKTTYLSALTLSLIESNWYKSIPMNKTIQNKFTTKLNSTGSFMNDSIDHSKLITSQRPLFVKHQILIHFCNGLSITGLPSNKKLNEILQYWLNLLIIQLDNICNCNDILKKLLNELKLSFNVDKISSNMDLKFYIQCFARFINFLGYLNDIQFAFLIDDCDQLEPMTLEWLPQILPKNVRFVLTCDSKSSVARNLCNRIDCQLLTVSGLTTHERGAAVRSLLGKYGKVLNESGFRNQLSVLIQKRDASIPLYLKLACDELRLYSNYEQLDAKLKQLPDTISSLVIDVIKRVECSCGSELTRITLGLLTCSRQPLSTEELHNLIDEWLIESWMEEQYKNGYTDSWQELKVPLDNLDNIMSNEKIIYRIINDQFNNKNKPMLSKGQPHLPSLLLYILLTGLHPLLSGFTDERSDIDEIDEELPFDDSMQTIKQKKLTIWNLGSRALSFSSREIHNLVYDICFSQSKYSIGHKKYEYSFKNNQTKNCNKRAKYSESIPDDKIHLKTVTLQTIHNILASKLRNMKDLIYHLHHAGRLNEVVCLLTSPAFLIHQIESGYGLTLLDDMNRYITTTTTTHHQSESNNIPTSLDFMRDKIRTMQRFLASNYEFLIKHPYSFTELAINQDVDEWIHTIGYASLLSSNYQEKINGDLCKKFFRIKLNTNDNSCILPKIIQPIAIHKPVTPLTGSQDIPIAIELDRTGNLLAYGTESGTVTVVEVQSFKTLCSFLGHNMPILSLCFLDDVDSSTVRSYSIPSSQLWLVSTSQDASILIWDLSNVIKSVTCGITTSTSSQLCSLGGYHNKPVTVSAWHPKRRLLATGGLDCLICLWEVGELGFGSYFTSISSGCKKIKPSKKLNIKSSINSIAFRLPNYASDSEKSIPPEYLRDVLAVGCWDGSVHFYSLISMSWIKSLAISSSAICSLAYSPNNGRLLAILDREGQSFILNADTFVYLGRLTENVSFSSINEFTSLDELHHLLPSQKGVLCFSKPTGRYLIQTGGGSSVGRINVWNAHLGAPEGPWINVIQNKKEMKRTVLATTYTIDISGKHIIIGWNDGLFTIVLITNGETIFSSDKLIPLINDNSSVQAIACGISPYCDDANLVIIGWSSGAVRLYHFSFRPGIKSKRDDNSTVQSDLHSICDVSIVPLYTSWSHSIEHAENGTGEAGGTLCAAASDFIAVSGGGNCEVWVYFVGSVLENPLVKSFCFREHSSQITAVAVQMGFIATGSKDKNVAIYKYDSNSTTVTLQYIIYNASKDWIISLKWSYILYKMSDRKLTLLVGSNDQLIRLYRIKSKKYKLKQTLVSDQSGIKSLDFNFPYIFSATSNGHISVWRYGKNGNFELISEMIISSPLDNLNSNTTNENVVNLIKIQSFEYTPCYNSSTNESVINTCDELEPHQSEDSVVDTLEFSNRSSSPLSNEDDSSQHHGITDENLFGDKNSMKGTSDYDELMDEGSDETPSQCSEKDLMTVDKCNNVAFNGDLSTGFQMFDKYINRPGSSSELLNGTNVKILIGQTISGSRNIQEFQFRVYEPSLTGYHATLSGHAGLIPCGLSCTKPLNSNNDDTLLISVAGQNCDSKTIGCDIRLWNLPLSNNSSLCKPTLQHTGPIICANYLNVTKNLQLCITGSVDGDCIIWAVYDSSTSQSINPMATTTTTTYQPLIRLTHSYMKPRYSINSIVTQRGIMDNEKTKIDYFIYIAFGYEILTLHIQLNHDSLMNEIDLENIILELFSNRKQLNINFIELNTLWSIQTMDGYAEIQRFKTDHIVVEMSTLHHEPVHMNQCGVVALLSNGEVVIIPFKHTDNELFHLRVRDNCNLSSHWCSSICTYQDGILVAHNGSALFHPFDDSTHVFTPLPGSINNLENIHIDRIEPLCLPNGNSFKLLYIVTSKLESEPRIIFFNNNEHMLLNISLEGTDLQVTAYCITSTHFANKTLIVYLLLATSDSFLRLFKCSINDSDESESSKWEQIKIYPTGEQIKNFTASHPIVKISPRYAKPNHLEQCEIIAVLVNGDVIVVTSNGRENFLFDQCTVQNGLWCSSIGTNDAGIFTTRSGMTFVCKHTDESRTFRRISGYMGSCEKEMWINSLSVLRTVLAEGGHFLYLAECHLINCWKILICNENGDLVTDFTLDNSSIKVTGYCAKLLSLTEDNCSTLIYLIISTSDNILHVLRCTINNPITVVNSNQWKQDSKLVLAS